MLVSILIETLTVLIDVFHNFSQSLQANDGIVRPIMPQPFPSTPFRVNCSLIVLAFDSLQS
jgi:hypothetical protein